MHLTWDNEVGYRAAYAWTRSALENLPKLKHATWEIMPPPDELGTAGSATVAPVQLPVVTSAADTVPGTASPAGARLHILLSDALNFLAGPRWARMALPTGANGTQGSAKAPPPIGSLLQVFVVCWQAQPAGFLKGRGLAPCRCLGKPGGCLRAAGLISWKLAHDCRLGPPEHTNLLYEFFEQVGEGSYGTVYRACCRQGGKLVAIKRFQETGKAPCRVRAVAHELGVCLDGPGARGGGSSVTRCFPPPTITQTGE